MNVSRNFLFIGTIYIVVGMILGSYMGVSDDRTLAPLHAHINLLGFVLPALFSLCYKVFPKLAEGGLARIHFWMHEVGILILLFALFLMLSGRVAATTIGPVMPIAELLIIVGTVLFAWNVYKNVD